MRSESKITQRFVGHCDDCESVAKAGYLLILWVRNVGRTQLGYFSAPFSIDRQTEVIQIFSWKISWFAGYKRFTCIGILVGMIGGPGSAGWVNPNTCM